MRRGPVVVGVLLPNRMKRSIRTDYDNRYCARSARENCKFVSAVGRRSCSVSNPYFVMPRRGSGTDFALWG
eukprot:2833204-Prymnesium_polylepis.2